MSRKPPISWEETWSDIERYMDDVVYNPSKKIVGCKKVYGIYSKVYILCVQRPPYNFSHRVYETIVKYHEDLVDRLIEDHNEHFDKHRLDVKHKDFVLWKHSKYIITWYKKVFLYLDQYYTKREKLPSISDVLHQCWISKGRPTYTPEQEKDYMDKWKALLRAKQKLQLAKLSYFPKFSYFPEDLYDIIIPHLSSNPVTDEYAFKTLHIHLEYNTSRSLIMNFKLMD